MRPSLVVFDLDFTLWDTGGVWIDCSDYPFHKRPGGEIRDSSGKTLRLYPDVQEILKRLDDVSVDMALASRTSRPDWAEELLGLLGIRDRFVEAEIYPSSKVRHFEALRKKTGLAFDEMVFFDDEMRNIEEVGTLGVDARHVRNGLSLHDFEGTDLFA